MLMAAVTAVGVLGAAGVNAATVYTIAAATTGDTTYGFSAFAPATGYTNNGPSLTDGPVTFSGTAVLAMSAGLFGTSYGAPFISVQGSDIFSDTATLTLAGTHALSLDLESYYFPNDHLTFTLSDGSSLDATGLAAGHREFIGFTDSNLITSLNITDHTGGVIDIVDFTVSGVAGVPEPATWAMMLMGFGGLGATLRRRRAPPLADALTGQLLNGALGEKLGAIIGPDPSFSNGAPELIPPHSLH